MERATPWLIGLLLAAPVLFARFPPMNDLPLHEAVVGVLRHFGDRAYFPEGLYRLNLGHPNQAFYLLAWAASLVVSVPMACKLVVAVAIVAVPVSGARLARYLGRPAWVALLVAPLAVGWLFFWGVVANILGLAALLALLPTLDRACERPTVRGASLSLAALVALYCAHEAMLLVACAAVGLFAVLKPLAWRDTALRLAPLPPLLGLAIVQLRWQESLRTANNLAIPLITRTVWHKLVNVPGVICYEPPLRAAVFGCALVPVVWLAVMRWRGRTRAEDAPFRERLHQLRFELLTAILLLAYFTLPFTLNGATLVYQRFLAPAYALGVILAAPRVAGDKLPGALRLLLVASPLASLLAILPAFAMSHRSYRDYESLLARADPASSYMNIELDPFMPFETVRSLNLQGHAVALRGGRTVFDITQSPISPAVLALEHRWNESSSRLQHDPGSLVPDYDLRRYRYVFVHASDPSLSFAAQSLFRTDAELVGIAGAWALYRSTLPTVPLLAPDGPPPPPSARSIRAAEDN